jgi:hypothetical protein
VPDVGHFLSALNRCSVEVLLSLCALAAVVLQASVQPCTDAGVLSALSASMLCNACVPEIGYV